MNKAIVIGASSGIGEALATVLAENGFEVGLAARRIEQLKRVQQRLKTKSFIKTLDISKPEEACLYLDSLISEMNGVDLIIINSGIGHINKDLDWKLEKETIDINVAGFTAMADRAIHHFLK